MNKLRKQSDTTYPLFFLMVDSTDHVTGKTGLSPTVTISKNGGSFASPSGAVTEVGNGLYKVAGNATDSNTVGELWIHATGTAADPTDTSYTIVAYDPFDAVRLGLTALPNAAAEAAGGLYTRGSGAGQINQPANGQIDANAVKVSGTTQTARDLGASVLLSPGTGTGQVSLSSGQVTASSVSGNVSGSVLGSVNGVTGNVTGSVGSVVGHVSGNLLGNVTGSVGSVVGIVTANMTQIDGAATNGNNATLKLKSLDIRSNDVSVNALDVRGATGGAGISGGNAVNISGGSSGSGGSDGGHGVYVKGGSGTSTRGAGLYADAPTGGSGVIVRGDGNPALYILGQGTGSVGIKVSSANGDAMQVMSLGNGGKGIIVYGNGSGSGLELVGGTSSPGLKSTGGTTGNGATFIGGATSGYGISAIGTGGNIDIDADIGGSIGSLSTQAKADVNAEVKDVLETDTQSEPSGVPAAASSFKEKIGWIFARMRNKQTQTRSTGVEKVYADNSVTEIGTSTDSDDGTTFTKGKMS